MEEEESYNPYMFDSKGPRKTIDYSKPDADDDQDQVMYDE